jgi:hypothetical protein
MTPFAPDPRIKFLKQKARADQKRRHARQVMTAIAVGIALFAVFVPAARYYAKLRQSWRDQARQQLEDAREQEALLAAREAIRQQAQDQMAETFRLARERQAQAALDHQNEWKARQDAAAQARRDAANALDRARELANRRAAEQERLLQERVDAIYPTVRSAYKAGRGKGASHDKVGERKAAIARELAKARTRMKEQFALTNAEIDQIIQIGEYQDGTAEKRAIAANVARTRNDARDQNNQDLGSIGAQINAAAGTIRPTGPMALPPPNLAPFR